MLRSLRLRVARALLAEAMPDVPVRTETPPPERVTGDSFMLNPGPELGPEVKDEATDSPEERARLLAILLVNPSGLTGYELLDRYGIPPETLERARLEGQVGWAERGVGLTHAFGGAWAADQDNPSVVPLPHDDHQKAFMSKLQEQGVV